jgi:hypothetical protein
LVHVIHPNNYHLGLLRATGLGGCERANGYMQLGRASASVRVSDRMDVDCA